MRRSLALRRTGAALTLPLLLALTSCADDSTTAEDNTSVTENASEEDASQASEQKKQEEESQAEEKPDSPDGKASPSAPGSATGGKSPLATLDAEPGQAVTAKSFEAIARWAVDNATTANIVLESKAQGGISGKGSVDQTTSPVSLQIDINVGGEKGSVRLVDGAIYMPVKLPSGEKYLKLDLGDAGNGSELSAFDPSNSLKQGIGKKKFTYRGEETIDGQSAQRFSSDEIDVWFDDSGLFRRIKVGKGDKTTTATYSDWGTAVQISAPPADEVQEMPDLPNLPSAPSKAP